MGIWYNPRGKSTFGLGICDRCSQKMSLDDLYPDPNFPGLRVCMDDLDVLDPWRLPARQTEDISLPFTRPDRPLGLSLAQSQYQYPPPNGGGYITKTPPTPASSLREG